LKENFGSTYSSLIKELMTHRLAGYYYLPRVEIDQDMGCYVVLLRQIRSIPGNLAKLLPGGLRRADVLSKFPDQAGHFRWPDSASAAIPEGVIPSPHIEHLLQSFSLLFGRIGLPDTDSKHIEKYLV
jgi:hypothetical protein